jgi:type I restriction enzyme S subunit
MSWERIKLGKYCTITSSKRFHLSDRSESGIPFYCSKEIIQKNKGQDITECDYIKEESYEEVKKKFGVPQAGDLLITTRGTYGVPYIYKADDLFYFADGNLTWLKDFDENLSVKFLYYWFLSYEGQKKIDAIAKGTAQKAVPILQIKEIDLSIPPIEIQQEIADILSNYDNLIENNQKQIKLIEEAAQRLYKEWFVDLRFPGYEDVEIIDGVPEGWNTSKINDLVEIRSGYAFKSSWWQEKGVPVVKIKDICNNFVNIGELDCVGDDKVEKCKEFALSKGDIVIAMTGATIGKIGIVPENGFYTNQRVGKFFTKYDNMTPFLFCYYNQKSTIESILAISSSSSAQPNISGTQLTGFELIYDIEIIKQFNKLLMHAFEKMLVLIKQNNYLSAQRDLILPKLMNGEIEV